MKKLILAILAIMLAVLGTVALAGCGGASPSLPEATPSALSEPAPVTTPAPAPAADPTVGITAPAGPVTSVFYFVAQGNTIYLDADINEILAVMGEPIDTFDRPSCAFDGIDRFFLFPGVQIQTYPIAGEDRVHTLILTDDSLSTVGGIFLGSSLADLLAAYGHEYDYSYGMYIFTRGNTTARFVVNDNIVQTISYELLTN